MNAVKRVCGAVSVMETNVTVVRSRQLHSKSSAGSGHGSLGGLFRAQAILVEVTGAQDEPVAQAQFESSRYLVAREAVGGELSHSGQGHAFAAHHVIAKADVDERGQLEALAALHDGQPFGSPLGGPGGRGLLR